MSLLGGDSSLWKGGLNVGRKGPKPPPDQPPVAGFDMATVVSGGTITIDALENDADPEGKALTITGASSASGSVEITQDGFLRYTAPADLVGTDTIAYTIADPAGNTAEGQVTITVNAPDQPPVADPDSATVVAGGTVSIDVLANDTDPEGGTLTVTAASAVSGGVVIEPDNTLSYTAPADFSGTDTISYTVADPAGNASQGQVTVTVEAADEPPVVGPDSAIVASGGTVRIDVLANDTDPEGGTLTVTAASAVSGGVVIEPDNTLSYTAPADFSGTDTVSYTVADPAGNASQGQAIVTVIALAIQTDGSLGDFTVVADDGEFVLTVIEPASFAGDYIVLTADLQAGPLNLQPPSVSGGQADGDTLTATAGLWAYDEAHGPLAFTQQWYRGGTPIDGATGDSYIVQPGDATTGLRFVRTATNSAGTRAIEIEALPATPSSFEESGVVFDARDTYLTRNADLAADAKESVWFVSLTPKSLGRQSILRQANLHNGVQIWYDQFQLRLMIDGTDRNVSSRPLIAGKRAHALASVTDNNGFSRLSLWTRFEGETGWTEEQTFSVTGGLADLSFGGFTVGARHTPTTSHNLDSVLFRLAVWAGGSYPEAITQSARDALVKPDGTLNDPTAAYALFGTPRVDLYGPATEYTAGINHGSAGNFDTVNGVFVDA